MHNKIFPLFSLFLIVILFTIIIVVTIAPKKNNVFRTKAAERNTGFSLQTYCQDGYYNIPGESRCSRAPDCGGFTLAQVDTIEMMPNKDCLKQVVLGRPQTDACNGYPPACCYEMARLGDFTKCNGYWERLWCSPDLCQAAEQNGASDNQCEGGNGCLCAHAYEFYCKDNGMKKAVPIEVRLGLAVASPPPPTPTNIPQPTEIPTLSPTNYLEPPPTTVPIRRPTAFPTQQFIIPTRNETRTTSYEPHPIVPFSLTLPSIPKEKIIQTASPYLDIFTRIFNTINFYDNKIEYAINTKIKQIYFRH